MSRYPQTAALGNEVIAAAKKWAKGIRLDWPDAVLLEDWELDLLHAVDAYEEAVALPQARGPDIDADG